VIKTPEACWCVHRSATGKARPFVRPDNSQNRGNGAGRPWSSSVVAQSAATGDQPAPVGRESRLGDALAGLAQDLAVARRQIAVLKRENAVFVVLQDTLTRGERTLVEAGENDAVLDLRRRWQKVMRSSCSRKIEDLTGRKVVGFMSDNHIDPDIAVEVFILGALAGDSTGRPPSSSAEPARR
jgi:uncharacterized protein YbcI